MTGTSLPAQLPAGARSARSATSRCDEARSATSRRDEVLAARRDERDRIARDLHDAVVHQLFSLRLQAAALCRSLGALPAGEVVEAGRVRDAAGELLELAGDALCELRALIGGLRPPELDALGLAGCLRLRAGAIAVRTGLAVDVEETGRLPGLDPDLAEDLYRVAQEALTNVVKHAGASRVTIRLDAVPGLVTLEVEDDGRGLGTLSGEGGRFGLVSIRQRAQRWGGTAEVTRRAGGGTRMLVRVPAAEPAATAAGAARRTGGAA